MKQLLKKYLFALATFLGKLINFSKGKSLMALACFFSFVFVFCCIYITASRNVAIKYTRFYLNKTISYLNEIGVDIAYDNIEFNSAFFSPLINIDDLQIYNISGLNKWSLKFKKVNAYSNIFGSPRIKFEFSSGGEFIFNSFSSQMASSETFLEISSKNQDLKELAFHSEDIDIRDFAKIKKLAFLLQTSEIENTNTAVSVPEYDSFLEINDVDINGLIKYPLSSHLKRLYAKASIIGKVKPEEYLLTTMETWLKEGGFIEVPSLIVQWQPLTLVGRGNVNFNESFSPRINFNTSSKGILNLIRDLQDNSFLDSKNVFVANILLTNKAFKLNPEDEEFTISTPISYSDGKISIENLTIKDFTK